MSLFTRLVEVTYNGVLAKQRSITSLFPTFYKRVDKVKSSGGVKLVNQFPVWWQFSVASASGKGYYNVYLKLIWLFCCSRQDSSKIQAKILE